MFSLDASRPFDEHHEHVGPLLGLKATKREFRMQTELTRRLGIKYPIVSAPLGRGANAHFLGAMANAGAFGFVALMHMPEEAVRQELSSIAGATAGRFGVNLTLVVDQQRRLEAALRSGVRAVSLWQGDPEPYIRSIKDAGAIVFWTIGSPEEAARARDLGVDFIVCQGREAGGHLVGQASTMTLLPSIIDASNGVPVIAAGGIADGRAMAAAFVMGAHGVWMGTRFVASAEAGLHPGYKHRVLSARADDLVETTLFDGGWPDSPHRVIRNSTVANWEAAGCPPSGHRPGEGDVIFNFPDGKQLLRYDVSTPWDSMGENWEVGPLYAGMSASLIHEIASVDQIVSRTVAEAQSSIRAAQTVLEL